MNSSTTSAPTQYNNLTNLSTNDTKDNKKDQEK